LLELGELGSWEGLVGYYAADEGVEDGGAEEGAIGGFWAVSLLARVFGLEVFGGFGGAKGENGGEGWFWVYGLFGARELAFLP
jgi:hypothetical protein